MSFLSVSKNYQIFLDGENVSRLIEDNIKITHNRQNIHNSIEFSSNSNEFFVKANPLINQGKPRIEIRIEGKSYFFLLEEYSGTIDTAEISYWGRDTTAQESETWREKETVVLTEWTSAKEVCQSLLSFCSLTWNIMDWVLPPSFRQDNYPIEIIKSIVSEIGAIIRSRNNNLVVEYPFKVRPYLLSTIVFPVSIDLTQDKIYDVSFVQATGNHCNFVDVSCQTNDKEAPVLELEEVEGVRVIGTDSFVKVYWFEPPPEVTNASMILNFTTDGSILQDSIGFTTHEEVITFTDGVGNVAYPIFEIISIVWIGKPNIVSSWDQFSTEIVLEETNNYRIAKITYSAQYVRYKVFGHNVEKLLAEWAIKNWHDKSIRVISAPIYGEKGGEEVIVNYLTNDSALVKRGEIWLDENKYDKTILTLKTPFAELLDGDIIWLDVDNFPPSYVYVNNSTIEIIDGSVSHTIEVSLWQI